MTTQPPAPKASKIIVDVYSGDTPTLADPEVPFIYADDLAAVRGDGVFETLMLRDGAVSKIERHAKRFQKSAKMLDLPEPHMDRWMAATAVAREAYMAQIVGDSERTPAGIAPTTTPSVEAAMRWVYSRGRESTGEPTGWITVSPVAPSILAARQSGVRVMSAARGYLIDFSQCSPWALVGAKTLSYAANMAALRAAAAQGLDDVIFVSDEGKVLEGPTSSVVAVQGNTLVTPPIEEGILPGTTQAALFAVAQERGWNTGMRSLSISDLQHSDGVWLLSSVRVHARVTQLDGVLLPRPAIADEFEAMVWEATR